MKKLLLASLLTLWAWCPAFADGTINTLGAAAAVQSTDVFPAFQGTNPATGVTGAQLKTFAAGVTSIATSCGVTGGTITTTGTISGTVPISLQTGVNYPIQSTDCGKLINLSNASTQTPTIATAGTGGFVSGWYVQVCNQNAGVQNITPTSGTIGGLSPYPLLAGSAAAPSCVTIVSDGSNYQVVPGPNGGTTTIASGTAALGTSAIASAACATVVTATATGTATTDVVTASFNGDPTAVTGYIPATAGMLTIITYPTANTFNAKVCNNTSASITPGAIMLNWRVVR